MNFRELVQEAVGILGAEQSYNEEKNVFSVKVIFEGNADETVYVYQDTFENEEDGISKKIIVCEALVGKYEENIDLLNLSNSNDDLFFSRAYVSGEEGKILVESCSFMENLNSLNLSAVIDEIAQHSNYIREELLGKN
jgi:hypothetical protein